MLLAAAGRDSAAIAAPPHGMASAAAVAPLHSMARGAQPGHDDGNGYGDGYGHGAHACPGQALSQTIAAAALEVLLRDGPPAPVAWRYRPSVNARIPEFIEEKETA